MRDRRGVMLIIFLGLPLEPYPWVDTNWGSDQDYRFRKKGSDNGSDLIRGTVVPIEIFSTFKIFWGQNLVFHL